MQNVTARGNFEFENRMGDALRVTASAKGLYFEAHSEWAGDTETGFGSTCMVDLPREAVEALRNYLSAWLASGTAQ